MLWLSCGLPAHRKKKKKPICNFLLSRRVDDFTTDLVATKTRNQKYFTRNILFSSHILFVFASNFSALVKINKVKSLATGLGCVIWGIPVISSQRKTGKRFTGSTDGHRFLYMLYRSAQGCKWALGWTGMNDHLGHIHTAHRQTSAAQKGRVSFIKAGSFPSCLVSL